MSMERLRGMLEAAGITPRGEDEADINAMCELYKIQTTGQESPVASAAGYNNLHMAQAMREIMEGWAIHMSCWIDVDDGGLKYEIKATETIPKDVVGKTKKEMVNGEEVDVPVRVPRTVGLAIRGPEPQTPNDLANSILNIHFINAMNAINRQIHDIPSMEAADAPEDTDGEG